MSDEAILLDSKTVNYLAPALQKLAQGKHPKSNLFAVTYPQLVQQWKQALMALKLDANFAVLYQLRYSGASWDALQKHRSLLEITEGKMVSGLGPEEVRVTCQSCADIRETTPKSEERSNGISSLTAGNGFRMFFPKNHNGMKPALELFAGCAAFSKSLCASGFIVHAYDVEWGAHGDILKPTLFLQLMHDILQKHFSFVHFGMPCESWSRARKWDGGPPPLRDDGPNLNGFANRPLADLLKIDKGNNLLNHTVALARQCVKSGTPWTLENPLTSRAWETEEIDSLVSLGATPQHVHYCQYNKPWRKATTFLGWKVPSFNFRLCSGSHGVCNATGLRHTILQGLQPTWLKLENAGAEAEGLQSW